MFASSALICIPFAVAVLASLPLAHASGTGRAWPGSPGALSEGPCGVDVRGCVEVSTTEELRGALSDHSVIEVVLMVQEIVLQTPSFSPESPIRISRDVVVRGSRSESWPVLVNKMEDRTSGSPIELRACILLYQLRIEGWLVMSETSDLKQPGISNSILSVPGLDVFWPGRDPNSESPRDDFAGRWVQDFGTSPSQDPAGNVTVVIMQECILDLTPSLLLRAITNEASNPWYGVLDLLKTLGLDWYEELGGELGVMEWPLRAIFYHDRAVLPFWSWLGYRFYNSTMYWNGPISEPVPAPDTMQQFDCQSSGRVGRGLDYHGNHSSPSSGTECIPWKDLNFLGADFNGLEGNNCRNPGTVHTGAFCFKPVDVGVSDELILPILEPCDIPKCTGDEQLPPTADCQAEADKGQSYTGTMALSKNGNACLNWTDIVYAAYSPNNKNYCRNPDGERDKLWCFTKKPFTWEFCDVPFCQPVTSPSFPGMALPQPPSAPPASKSQPMEPPPVPPAPKPPSAMGADVPDKTLPTSSGLGIPQLIGIVGAGITFFLAISLFFAVRHVRWKKALVVGSRASSSTGGMGARASDGQSFTSSSSLRSKGVAGSMALSKISFLDEDPQKLGLIHLREPIGTGYTAQVWQSSWMGVTVACKIMNIQLMSAGIRDKVVEGMEASMVTELSHPNVVRVFQIYHVNQAMLRSEGAVSAVTPLVNNLSPGSSPDQDTGIDKNTEQLWIVQEFCEGGDLRRAIHDKRFCMDEAPHLPAVLRVLKEIALALKYLHSQGIVHGDLKCENVLLDKMTAGPDEHVTIKVTDFGLAHALPQGTESYYSHNLVADYTYMAPEALLDKKVSAKMDSYSFGLLAYEMVTNSKIETPHTFARQAAKLANGARPPLPEHMDPGFEALIQGCWAQKPNARPSSDDIAFMIESMITRGNCYDNTMPDARSAMRNRAISNVSAGSINYAAIGTLGSHSTENETSPQGYLMPAEDSGNPITTLKFMEISQ